MARRAVPAREVAGGTNVRAALAFERVAPLNAARTSQRDVIYQAKHIRAQRLPWVKRPKEFFSLSSSSEETPPSPIG
jgi:hypothetical protein